jgi:hypothetical protein
MHVMKCTKGEKFSQGSLIRYGNIEISPAAGIINYGQVKSAQYMFVEIPLYDGFKLRLRLLLHWFILLENVTDAVKTAVVIPLQRPQNSLYYSHNYSW